MTPVAPGPGPALTARTYLDFLAKEYLADFIRRGGTAVKFAVVADQATGDAFQSGLADLAASEGYAHAWVDASIVRAHMVDQVFFAIARQLDWEAMAATFVRSAYVAVGLSAPPAEAGLSVAAAAAHLDLDERELYRSLRRHLEQRVLGDDAMAHEFRLAMLRLCQAHLVTGDVDDVEHEAVLDWLRGELRQLAQVRSSLIFQRIGRHNARAMLASLATGSPAPDAPGWSSTSTSPGWRSPGAPRSTSARACTTPRRPSWTPTRCCAS